MHPGRHPNIDLDLWQSRHERYAEIAIEACNTPLGDRGVLIQRLGHLSREMEFEEWSIADLCRDKEPEDYVIDAIGPSHDLVGDPWILARGAIYVDRALTNERRDFVTLTTSRNTPWACASLGRATHLIQQAQKIHLSLSAQLDGQMETETMFQDSMTRLFGRRPLVHSRGIVRLDGNPDEVKAWGNRLQDVLDDVEPGVLISTRGLLVDQAGDLNPEPSIVRTIGLPHPVLHGWWARLRAELILDKHLAGNFLQPAGRSEGMTASLAELVSHIYGMQAVQIALSTSPMATARLFGRGEELRDVGPPPKDLFGGAENNSYIDVPNETWVTDMQAAMVERNPVERGLILPSLEYVLSL